MTSLKLPSRTAPTPEDQARFDRLTARMRAKLRPQTLEQYVVADDLIIAAWLLSSFKFKAATIRRQIKALESANPDGIDIAELRREFARAEHQIRNQKNFAWRRRRYFWRLRFEFAQANGEPIDNDISVYHRPDDSEIPTDSEFEDIFNETHADLPQAA